jgi:hypothetical protein
MTGRPLKTVAGQGSGDMIRVDLHFDGCGAGMSGLGRWKVTGVALSPNCHAPRRAILPAGQHFDRLIGRLVRMAQCAGVRNVGPLSRGGRDEPESVRMHLHISQRLLDQGHVTRNALAAGAVRLVMRMPRDAVCERTCGGVRTVTAEAQRVALFPQHRDIVAAVRIMAGKAGHTARVQSDSVRNRCPASGSYAPFRLESG